MPDYLIGSCNDGQCATPQPAKIGYSEVIPSRCGPSGCPPQMGNRVLTQSYPTQMHVTPVQELYYAPPCTTGRCGAPERPLPGSLEVAPARCSLEGQSTYQPFDRTKHAQDVKSFFRYTDQNYGAALDDAARQGKAVVAVFGSQNTRGIMNYLPDVIGEAQRCSVSGRPVKDDAVFIYIDTERVKKENGQLADFVKQSGITGELPRTLLFSMEREADGSARPGAIKMQHDGFSLRDTQLAAEISAVKSQAKPIEMTNPPAKIKDGDVKQVSGRQVNLEEQLRARDRELLIKDIESIKHEQFMSELKNRLKERDRQMVEMQEEMTALRSELRQMARDGAKLDAKRSDAHPVGAQPASTKPLETKSIDRKPFESKPAETKAPTARFQPADTARILETVAPDAATKQAQAAKKAAATVAGFEELSKSEEPRLAKSLATARDDHPTATPEFTKWLLQQDDMNLLRDSDVRRRMNNMGTYVFSSRIDDENKIQGERGDQWEKLRSSCFDRNDPNHESKQLLLHEFMRGNHIDGFRYGNTNSSRGDAPLKTDTLAWQNQAAEALVKTATASGVKHELASRLIVDGLSDLTIPVQTRIKLLDAIEPLSKDAGNEFMAGHARETAIAAVTRALLKSHQAGESNGDFQRAALAKLSSMEATEATSVIKRIASEAASTRTRREAQQAADKLKGVGK